MCLIVFICIEGVAVDGLGTVVVFDWMFGLDAVASPWGVVAWMRLEVITPMRG